MSLRTCDWPEAACEFGDPHRSVVGLSISTSILIASAVAGIVDALLAMFSRTRLVLGLQPRLVFAPRATSIRSALAARRLVSTSSCAHAQFDPKHQLEHLSSGIEERQAHQIPHAPHEYDAQGVPINPYVNGPSALDKAVHLFFFTEIIRGWFSLLCPTDVS
jgi:hypothetical protein